MDSSVERTLKRLEQLDARIRSLDQDSPLRLHIVGCHTGRLLYRLAMRMQPARILEIGTGQAYSTIWMAAACKRFGGRILSIDNNLSVMKLASVNLECARSSDYVDLICGEARSVLKVIRGRFNLIFLDAAKEEYLSYFMNSIHLLGANGHIVADNMISHAAMLRDFKEEIRLDGRFWSKTLNVGKGVLVVGRIS